MRGFGSDRLSQIKLSQWKRPTEYRMQNNFVGELYTAVVYINGLATTL